MKKWTFVLPGLLLVLAFQNCQKAGTGGVASSSSPGSTASGVSNIQYNKTSAQSATVLQLWDYDHARTLDLDLASGRMSVYLNYGTQRGTDLCVTEAERQQVQALLAAAEVCEPIIPAAPEGQQCIQVYKYPYAVLVAGSDETRLGEKTNGCDIPTDLCGTQAQALKDFVQSVLSSLDQRACQ